MSEPTYVKCIETEQVLNIMLNKYLEGHVTSEQIILNFPSTLLVHMILNLRDKAVRELEYVKNLKRHLTFASQANARKRNYIKTNRRRMETALHKSREKVEIVITEAKLLADAKVVSIGSSVADRIQAGIQETEQLVETINQLVAERNRNAKAINPKREETEVEEAES